MWDIILGLFVTIRWYSNRAEELYAEELNVQTNATETEWSTLWGWFRSHGLISMSELMIRYIDIANWWCIIIK